MVCVDAGGRIVMVNAQMVQLFGYPREDLEGQPVEMLVPGAVRAVHPQHRTGYMADPVPRPMGAGMQLAGCRRDGSTFPAEISLSAIDTDEGILVTAAVRDVTEQQRRQDDLERAVRNLETFTYSVAHDLRAPLRALGGYSSALMEDCADYLGEVGRGYAERILAASGQMSALIDGLLVLSRIARAEVRLEGVDLGAEVARIAAELQDGAPGRRVHFAIERPVQARADRLLIRTVLQNLVENAWKFTSGQDDALIEFGSAPAGDAAICCYVRDDGAGFDPHYAGKLFQPFQRLHPASDFPGTGIGLAIIKQVVERHGGRAWAEGAVGEGATFYFTLNTEEIA
jgi:PAS domain S-box-containing protein